MSKAPRSHGEHAQERRFVKWRMSCEEFEDACCQGPYITSEGMRFLSDHFGWDPIWRATDLSPFCKAHIRTEAKIN